VTFTMTGTIETISNSTGKSATTYPELFLRGFSQTATVQSASVSEVYFENYGGTWWGVLTGDISVVNSYNLLYYYK